MDPLNQYESSDDDDHSNTSDTENKPPCGRGDARPWKYDCPLETPEEARKFVESEGNWSIIDTNKTIGGKIKYYRCNRVKRRGPQCDAALYLHYPSSSLQVHLYRTDCDHTCHQIVQSSQRITETMRSEIDRMLVLKQKPKTIYEHLYDQGFRPTMKQIYNYSSAWRKKRFGPSSISLGELEEWCLSHQENPESVDDSYVIAHEIEYGDEDYEQQQSKKRKKNNEASFKVIISTKRLLQHIEGIDHVHCDATYKLTWEGMPVLIVGTTCMDKTFHPICIAVCSNEQKSSFSFIFRSLKEKAGLNAKFLVSDASDAIREAFIQVFGSSSKLAMCWAHAERCMEKKLHLVSEENKEEIWHDVQSLQICPDNSTFNKAKTLFIKKWTKKGENAFVEYMQLQWLTTHDGWHEGVGDETCLPSTNNGQESFNRVLKDEETLRERMPLGQFFEQCLESSKRWSRWYEMGLKQIAELPTIDLNDWTGAYQWVKLKKDISTDEINDCTEYYCPAGDQQVVSVEDISRSKNKKWNTFDQFLKRAFSVWIVRMSGDDWQNASCTCPLFRKEYKCKHQLGIAIRLKLVKPPPAAKQVPIGEKRKKGRPKKAKHALLID